MSDPTDTLLQKTDPACLDQTVAALQTLSGGPSRGTSTAAAKHYLPLQYMEPEGSKDFDNDEKAFLKVDAFNQISGKSGISYSSPHTQKCYSGNQQDATFQQADTQQHQKQLDEQDSAVEQELKTFQKAANEVWDSYRQLYYGFDDSVGSVFVKTVNGATLEALFGIHKHCKTDGARWDSVHVVTIAPPNMSNKTCDYKIDSAVWCSLQQNQGQTRQSVDAENLKSKSSICAATTSTAATLVKETNRPQMKLMGILNNNNTNSKAAIPSAAHIENIGQLLEQIEMDFRSQLERVVMPKAVEVMQGIYREPGKSATVHLMDENEENVEDNNTTNNKRSSSTTATGMGVGKDMIGDIADSARSKDSDRVVETVAQQKIEKVAARSNSSDGSSSDYSNMRASLKSPKLSSPKAKVSPSSPFNGATPEFVNFRDKLKSPIKK